MIVLSPHLDDAVFSCGSLLGHVDATVVTVCAGIPDESVKPGPLDVRSGFVSAADAVRGRLAEDVEAMEALGLGHVHLDCLDHAYAGGEARSVAETIAAQLRGVEGDVLLAPLGLHHPDHEAVALAVESYGDVFQLWFYEERPYGVRWPEEVPDAIRRRGCEQEPLEVLSSEAKLSAMSFYASQLVQTDLRPYKQPERYRRG